MVLAFRWIGSWPYYPMVTPLVLTAGLLGLVWSWRRSGVRRSAVLLALVAVGVCVFWATATLAQWTGLGVAQRTARNLDDLPSVVVDTKERLYLGFTEDAGVTETTLPEDKDQGFRYRYRGLRLLIQAGDRMFLVPERWSPSGSTLLVPIDDVRVRFRFVERPTGLASAAGQWPSGRSGANGHSSKAAHRPSCAKRTTHRSRQVVPLAA